MTKFFRRPCDKCAKDTLHNLLVCTECGNIAVMKRRFSEIKNARLRRMVARGIHPGVAAASIRLGTSENRGLASQKEWEKLVQDRAKRTKEKRDSAKGALGKNGLFGVGRELQFKK